MAHGTAACRLGASMRDVFRSAEADTLVAAPLTADRAPRRRGSSAPGWQPPAASFIFDSYRLSLPMHRPPIAIRCGIRFCIGHRGPAARLNCGYFSAIHFSYRFYKTRPGPVPVARSVSTMSVHLYDDLRTELQIPPLPPTLATGGPSPRRQASRPRAAAPRAG